MPGGGARRRARYRARGVSVRGGGGGHGAASGALAVLPAAVPADLAGQPLLISVDHRIFI